MVDIALKCGDWHHEGTNNTQFRGFRPIEGGGKVWREGVALASPITHPMLQPRNFLGHFSINWVERSLTPKCLARNKSGPLLRMRSTHFCCVSDSTCLI